MDDSEVTRPAAVAEVIKHEYHVLYSCSYQVPVLYFRASFLGKTMSNTESKFINFPYKTGSIFGKSFLRGEENRG
jgi:hypothetical protein